MDMEELVKRWKEGIGGDSTESYKGFDMLHIVWYPKWKWFKPPMWKIFKWAFNIDKTLYTNCYPKAIGEMSIEIMSKASVPRNEITLTFNAEEEKGRPEDVEVHDRIKSMMNICKYCEEYYDPAVHPDGCPKRMRCAAVYHKGHIDGVYEGGTGNEEYRGDLKYRDEE